MKKMTTLYKKDPNDLSRVINEIDPENEWVFSHGVPTVKFDGTAVAIIEGEIYKRYDAKHGKKPPEGAIPCQEPDEITGHWPHWVKCDRENPADKYFFEAFDKKDKWEDGTYELCGPKLQGNPEKLEENILLKHGCSTPDDFNHLSFDGIKKYFENPENDMEGVVFHDDTGQGRMCKIRKGDFGIKR